VTTHGGRQVDGAISAIEALPGCVQAVRAACIAKGQAADAVPVFFDSGVRYGFYPIVTSQYISTALHQVPYHIQ
jgi:isopentenyl diphosphate isomerase/L-lactate dehydrogenase-like FMN-dependent dehydrogenase